VTIVITIDEHLDLGHLQRGDAFWTPKSGREHPFASPRGHILSARPFASGIASGMALIFTNCMLKCSFSALIKFSPSVVLDGTNNRSFTKKSWTGIILACEREGDVPCCH
jgi:hypothetical protein